MLIRVYHYERAPIENDFGQDFYFNKVLFGLTEKIAKTLYDAGYYKHVATIGVKDKASLWNNVEEILDWAYANTNHIDSDWTHALTGNMDFGLIWVQPGPQRSTSVGDIIVVDYCDGKMRRFTCNTFGWGEIK